jgi:predicted RNA-binding protein
LVRQVPITAQQVGAVVRDGVHIQKVADVLVIETTVETGGISALHIIGTEQDLGGAELVAHDLEVRKDLPAADKLHGSFVGY